MRATQFLLPLLLTLACETPPPANPAARGAAFLTLAELRAAYIAAPAAPLGVGLSSTFAAGFPPAYFLASRDEIRVSPAFAEGQPSAYISTDIWVNFSKVWAQPLYVFITGVDPTTREPVLANLPSVAAVGPESAFHSPFFRVFHVTVPADTPPDRYRTTRAILDAKLPVQEAGTRLVSLLPAPSMRPEDPAQILLPRLRGMVTLPRTREVWVDGQRDGSLALDFGPNRFETGPGHEIIDQPLYFFFTRDAAGAPAALTSIPRVGGTGPRFGNRPPVAPSNRPAYGSFWRLWAAHLPPSAAIFVPTARELEWNARSMPDWAGAGAPLPQLPRATAPALDRGDALDSHAFRVVLDGRCPAAATTMEAFLACPWLDSQAALERHLPPAALEPSEILVACPFVAHDGRPVPAP